MFGTYVYPWVVTIVVALVFLWPATVLARRHFFNPRVKCVQMTLDGKTR
ncbi:hypothetical protein LCGC14_1545320, partial [marine sediment metagenome]